MLTTRKVFISLLFVVLFANAFVACDNSNGTPPPDPSTCQHSFSEWVTTKPATCKETGTKIKTCTICAFEVTNTISKSYTHTEVIDKAVAPTCTATGLTEGKHCSVCNKIIVAQTTINKLQHDKIVDDAIPATCTEPGLTEGMHCGVCGEILITQKTINALNHAVVQDEAVAPTCTQTGLTEGTHCSRCDQVFVAQTVLEKLGHIEVIDEAVAPTCTRAGLTEGKHCSRCNTSLVSQMVVSALGHVEIIDLGTEPSCTQTGLTEGKHCAECGETIIVQAIIPQAPHEYVNYFCLHCNVLIDKNELISSENNRHAEYVAFCEESIELHTKEAERLKRVYGITKVSEEAGYYRGVLTEINTNIENLKDNISYYQAKEKWDGRDYSSMIKKCRDNLAKEQERKTLYERYLSIAVQQDEATVYRQCLTEEQTRHIDNLRMIDITHNCLQNGHTNIVVDSARNASCGQIGLSEGSHCADCNIIIIEQVKTPPLGHSFDSFRNKCAICGIPEPTTGLTYLFQSDTNEYILDFHGGCTASNVVIADIRTGYPVTAIAEKAFYKIQTINSLYVPENITSIGDYAFFRCEKLHTVSLPSTLKSIGNMAFYNCEKLTRINYGGTIAQWKEIEKVSGWDAWTAEYTVYCTDGTISKYDK